MCPELTYGSRQRELRLARKMGLRALAEAASPRVVDGRRLDFTYLSRIEQGVFPPPSEQVILRIAQALTLPGGDPRLIETELLSLARKPHPDAVAAVTAISPEGLDFLRAVREAPPDPRTWRRLQKVVERRAKKPYPEDRLPGDASA